MASITLNQLALQVHLDPKVIRRMIRKQFPALAGKGSYLFDDANPIYQQILDACKELTNPTKKTKKPRRERTFAPIQWNDKGYCIVDGEVWGLALVPQPDDPSKQVATSVWLGKAENILPVLEGKEGMVSGLTDRQMVAITQILEGKQRIIKGGK